jgi:hypothetical protein
VPSEDPAVPDFGESPVRFPSLPIVNPTVTPPAPPRGQREKYGALFYLGVAGLVLLVGLVGWFVHGVWSHRDLWADVYLMHDSSRTEAERVAAAARLGRDPRLADPQKLEMSLRRDLPDLARYRLAEAVSTDWVARDPRSTALAVARSPGWPDWLRLLLARRLAYGAARGYDIPREALEELKRHPDPMIGLWATYALAAGSGTASDPARAAELEKSTATPGPIGELAAQLLGALRITPEERERRLDEATIWLRRHHPQAAKVWQGRDARDPRPVPDGSD